jgi:protein-disulfide isomerase
MKAAILLFSCLMSAQTFPPEPPPASLNLENQPSFGPANAPVTIVEFGDLQCPSCRAEAPLLREVLPGLYPGKLRIVFKDFPLETVHPWARAASIAARCIFHQNADAFWKFYDWDYDNQEDITVDNLKSKVLGWAGKNGLDTTQLGGCIDMRTTDPEVAANIAEGKAAAVPGTPTLFINGRKSSSGQLAHVQEMIQKELDSHDAR